MLLTVANPIFATYLQARHMLRALRAGEPFRLASLTSALARHVAVLAETLVTRLVPLAAWRGVWV
jgi:hypothetical protein